ncbi:MAG: response regulator transcription factor [Chloroflexi bacterium]|nr:response regulator transcription factor [Chloroflexota bacterium]
MSGKKILVVDDEPKIRELVRVYLEKDGYQVVGVGDGREALAAFKREKPQLVVLDLMLPEIDGLEVCRTLRRESQVPIVMLTARDEETDKLIGLELGADDYVTKPFSPRELVARVRAVLRRASLPVQEGQQIVVGDLMIDSARHLVSCHGQTLNLTPTEFRLLEAMARHPGRVYTRLQLLELAQGDAYQGYERTVDAHVKNLRQKIEAVAPEGQCRIATVYGLGYKLETPQNA